MSETNLCMTVHFRRPLRRARHYRLSLHQAVLHCIDLLFIAYFLAEQIVNFSFCFLLPSPAEFIARTVRYLRGADQLPSVERHIIERAYKR